MNHDAYSNDYIAGILGSVKSVAIIGASANEVRPSYFVAKYLIGKGYEVHPVNPGHAGKLILGRMTYARLAHARPDSTRDTLPGGADDMKQQTRHEGGFAGC